MTDISIIIPTLNEAHSLPNLLHFLQEHRDERLKEIIVADGNSSDASLNVAEAYGALPLRCPKAGRSLQMNAGAAKAHGDILYFIHADTFPPSSYLDDIQAALARGLELGCYRSSYDSRDLRLKVNAFFTRFDLPFCRGGDQTLFVKRKVFEAVGGFREDYVIMEDFDFLKRARRQAHFGIMPKAATISARKYRKNAYFRVNFANLHVFYLYQRGASQQKLVETYRKWLKLDRYRLPKQASFPPTSN